MKRRHLPPLIISVPLNLRPKRVCGACACARGLYPLARSALSSGSLMFGSSLLCVLKENRSGTTLLAVASVCQVSLCVKERKKSLTELLLSYEMQVFKAYLRFPIMEFLPKASHLLRLTRRLRTEREHQSRRLVLLKQEGFTLQGRPWCEAAHGLSQLR